MVEPWRIHVESPGRMGEDAQSISCCRFLLLAISGEVFAGVCVDIDGFRGSVAASSITHRVSIVA